jgi:histone-lysine N-methyltransferase SETMAR
LEKIDELGWEVLRHPPYSPDLAPSDFHLFGPLKDHMRGKHFTTDDDVIGAVSEWLRRQPRDFYAKGINDFVTRWKICIEKDGDYVEK